MKKSLLASTLLAAAALSTPAFATDYTLSDGQSTLAEDNGTTTWAGDTFTINSSILNATNWGNTGCLGAWIGWSGKNSNSSLAVGSSDEKVTITGEGFFGIAYGYSNGDATVDLTNVVVSGFSGQLCVVNQWYGNAIVKLSGDQWAGVEYVFGSVTAEWAGVTSGGNGNWNSNDTTSNQTGKLGLFTRGTGNSDDSNHEHDTLALQGDTTFAGITGTSKDYHTDNGNYYANDDSITVTTAGTKLTIAGAGEYAFYGTVGASGAEVSLIMNSTTSENVAGNGKQTFGGTNYLKDVTVTAGTLALGGTTSIAGAVSVTSGALDISGSTTFGSTVSVAEGGTLELGGEVTLSSAITNSGTVIVDSDVVFVLSDSLGSDSTYTIISAGGEIQGWDNLNYSNFQLSDGTTLTSDRQLTITTGGQVTIDTNGGDALNLTWAGTSGSVWKNGSDEIWTNNSGSSPASFYDGDSVTFAEGDADKSVVLGGNVKAATVTITGSGYELSGNHTLTADTIVLDDEDSGTGHTFTIASGVTVKAGTLTETAGQLDLVVNGTLDVTGMTVSTTKDEAISGSGKLSVGTLTYDAVQGSSLTISVAQAEFTSIYEKAPATDNNSNAYRHLIFGDGKSATVASADYIEIRGVSEIQVASGSTLTVTELYDASGYNTTISGAGTFIAGSATFSGSGTVTISSANAVIGLVQSDATHTITIAEGATLTAGSLHRSKNILNLAVDGTLTVEQLEGYTDSTGMIYFGKSTDGAAGYDQTLSGSGIANVYGLEANLGTGSLNISVTNLNIGAGGITRLGSGNGTITINGTTIGLYKATTSEISAAVTIGTSGATFTPGSGESLTLSGAITGNGLVTKTGDGELAFTGTGSSLSSGLTVSAGTVSVATDASLTLGGTVTLASAISNSGTITIDSNTSFVIDGIERGTNGSHDYYVLITGNSGSITLGSSISFSDGTGTSWTVYTTGLESGYLVIYGEATTAQTAENLYWAGTDVNNTWTSSNSTVDWSTANDGSAGYYFQNGENVTFGSAAQSKSVTIAEAITAGAVTVDGAAYTWTFSGENASVTAGSLTFSGTGASLTITGEGEFDLGNSSGSKALDGSGTIEIAGGATLKLAANTDDKYEDTKITITVGSGGTLDVDGDGGTMFNLVLNGGTLTSSIDMTETKKQLPSITLTANSTVDATHSLGMIGSSYSETSLDLGNHTLTKTGDGNFFLHKTTVTAGTIDVTAGTLELYGTDASAAAITVETGATLVVGSANNNYESKVGTLTSSGTVDLKAGSTLEITGNSVISGTLSLETTDNNHSTLKVTGGANLTLNVSSVLVGSGSSLSIEGTSSLTLNTSLTFHDSNNSASGTVAFSSSAKLILSDSFLASATTPLDSEGQAVTIITASAITYNGVELSNENISAFVSNVISWSDNYTLDNWTYSQGTLSATVRAIPESSMFGVLFGLGAIGLVATRRRKRAA